MTDVAHIVAKMAATTRGQRRDAASFRVEVRRVGCAGSIVRHFVSRLDAMECFAGERQRSQDVARLVLSERVNGEWVDRSTLTVSVETRSRDLTARQRVTLQPVRTGH